MSFKYALVRKGRLEEVQAYLPSNYKARDCGEGEILISGRDSHGWTMEDYVRPRLMSGMIWAEPMTSLEVSDWLDGAERRSEL
jgi:hypothetical protein